MREQMDRMLGLMSGVREDRWVPPVSIYDKGERLLLKVDLPGVESEQVEIDVEDNVLTLRGERRMDEELDEERFYRIEGRHGPFERSIALPKGVKGDEISASYEDGVLTITVPKGEEIAPRRIGIEKRGGRETIESPIGREEKAA